MATNNSVNNTFPSPFTIGSTSVTSTGTQLNYLNALTAVPINKINIQVFTSTGAYTYTPTSGTQYAIIELQAGGGGSGGVAGVSSGAGTSGGGASGGYYKLFVTSANLVSCSGSVGIAGTAGTSGANNGGNGGNTTFVCNSGSTWTAGGGNGSVGVTGTGSSTCHAGGSITSNTNGTNATVILNIAGMIGASSYSPFVLNVPLYGGAGSNSMFGIGGSSFASITNPSTTVGNAATGYGAGGAGTVSVNGNTNATGAAGTQGIVIITEFISA